MNPSGTDTSQLSDRPEREKDTFLTARIFFSLDRCLLIGDPNHALNTYLSVFGVGILYKKILHLLYLQMIGFIALYALLIVKVTLFTQKKVAFLYNFNLTTLIAIISFD